MKGSGSGPAKPADRRIVIADDDRIVLDQIGRLLRPHFDVVARAENGQALLEAVRTLSPAIVVTDITMPEINGIDATRLITKSCPDVKVLVMSVHDDPVYVDAAFEAGAVGYVLKFAAARELVGAIQKVASGESYRSPALV